MDADVGVIGVGTMGSMAMWQLAKRGVSVLGFEQFGIGHDQSAAGGESRLFRTAYMEGNEYVPLLKASKQLWRELESDTNTELLMLNGGLTVGNPNLPQIKNLLSSIHTHHLEHEVLEGSDRTKFYPQFNVSSDDVMIVDKNAGFMRPELAVVSAARYAKSLGAKLSLYTKVNEIIPSSEGFRIETNKGSYKVKKLLVTTGAWTKNLLPMFKQTIIPKRLVLTWFTSKSIELFKPDQFPIFVRFMDDFRLTGAPTLDGTMVKVSYTAAPKQVPDPNQLDRNVSIDELEKLNLAVAESFPDLVPHPVRSSCYMDAYTPNNHSMVGAIPTLENAYVMTGFSGHGFKLSPIMGRIASDLIVDGKTTYNIDHLDPHRFDFAEKNL